MDRSRPLWECYVIEGLADGRWAMLTKTHHATIDGASGVILLKLITDLTPTRRTRSRARRGRRTGPERDRDVADDAGHLRRNPFKGVRAPAAARPRRRSSRRPHERQRAARQARDAVTAIATRIERRRTGRRARVAADHAGAADALEQGDHVAPPFRDAFDVAGEHQALKDATGCTVNDIVMAICAGALREYLLLHDALPDKPLRAMVPVSIRTGEEEDPWTNRVSGIIAELPRNLPTRSNA